MPNATNVVIVTVSYILYACQYIQRPVMTVHQLYTNESWAKQVSLVFGVLGSLGLLNASLGFLHISKLKKLLNIGAYDQMNGVGAHEVIIETPKHSLQLADAPLEHIEKALILTVSALSISCGTGGSSTC